MSTKVGRAINLLLALWLCTSAFLWTHTTPQLNNAWVVGLLAASTAAIAFAAPAMRWLNAGLAVWLFVSIWILPHATMATIWNSIIVATLMLIASLGTMDGVLRRRYPPRPLT